GSPGERRRTRSVILDRAANVLWWGKRRSPMAQAHWNGFLRVSLVSCPVRLASTTGEARRIRLDPINARTGNPVTQQFVDARTGDVVAPEAVVSGCKLDDERYLVLSAEDLQSLAQSPVNVIDIDRFVPRDQIGRLFFDAASYIHPEGQLAADTVHALRLAMERNGRVALGHIFLDGRERVVLIEPQAGGLLMSTLRAVEEIAPPEFAERPEHDIPAEMVEIAESIIARRSADFDPAMLRDRAEDALRALIAGRTRPAAPPTEPPAPPAAAAPPPSPEPPPPAPPPVAAPPPPAPPPVAAAPPPPPAPPPVAAVPPPPPAPEPPPAPPPPAPPPAAAPPPHNGAAPAAEGERGGARELGAEVLLHIMGLGDRRYVEPGWAGHPGSRRQIEAMSIRPREAFPPSAIEFRVFAQEGRATAWVSNGNYAGTRGRGLPLTGFAVRPAADLRDRLEIVYEGSFFEGGVVGPRRDGELCVSPVADDPLEAIRVTIVERKEG